MNSIQENTLSEWLQDKYIQEYTLSNDLKRNSLEKDPWIRNSLVY